MFAGSAIGCLAVVTGAPFRIGKKSDPTRKAAGALLFCLNHCESCRFFFLTGPPARVNNELINPYKEILISLLHPSGSPAIGTPKRTGFGPARRQFHCQSGTVMT